MQNESWPAAIPVGLWIWDVKRDCVYADKPLCRYFGMSDREGQKGAPIGRFLDRVHKDDRQETERRIRDVSHRGGGVQHSYRVQDRSGASRTITAVGTCFLEGDEPALFPGWIFDLSLQPEPSALKAVADLVGAARSWSKQDRVIYVLDTVAAELADMIRRLH